MQNTVTEKDNLAQIDLKSQKSIYKRFGARGAIRTHEFLRNQALNLAPLTWLGNSRMLACLLLYKI